MNAIADKYAGRDIGSIFLYSNEAHPGEIYPHLMSMEQKVEHGRALRDVYGVTRPIVLDGMDGACHRTYGSQPNMTWIFNKVGIPVYKSDWSDSHSVENAIIYLLEVLERRRGGERVVPFRVERLDYRIQDQEAFYDGLARNGPKAVQEFRDAGF
jgi:hypothetical protein